MNVKVSPGEALRAQAARSGLLRDLQRALAAGARPS